MVRVIPPGAGPLVLSQIRRGGRLSKYERGVGTRSLKRPDMPYSPTPSTSPISAPKTSSTPNPSRGLNRNSLPSHEST